MIFYLFALAAILLAWNIAPLVALSSFPVPTSVKLRAVPSLLSAAVRGLLTIIPSFPLVSMPVVFVALLGTKREAEKLPGWAWMWDNDVSINGDRGDEVYWLPKFLLWLPVRWRDNRSFLARWWWLGIRNRASRLSQVLGHHWTPEEYADHEHWGTITDFGDNMEGWALNRRGPAWQVYLFERMGGRRCFCMNYGFKVWQEEGDLRDVANIANVSASFPSWKGA